MVNDEEEARLRSVALQNSQSILLARRRAEEELIRAKEALERKTSELAQSLAMMRATLELTTDGILVTDGDGNVTGFSRNYVEMWGLPAELMETSSHADLLHACSVHFERPEQFLNRVSQIYAESPPESYDLLQLLDGRSFERFSRIQYVAGRNVGRVWSFRDITEHKRAEAALEERVRLTALRAEVADKLADTCGLDEILQRCAELMVRYLDVAFARIWLTNESGDVLELRASAGVYTHLDGPHGRVRVGQFKIGRIAQERAPHLTNDVANDPRISDPQWAHREGMVAFAGFPLLIGQRCVGVLAMFARRAMTENALADLAPLANSIAQCVERRHAEEALRKQSEWLRVTLSSIGDAVITTDTDSRITSMNPIAESLTGWQQAEAMGQSLGRVFHIVNESTRALVENPVARSLREGTIVGLANHTILIARDGQERAIDDSAAPIRDGDGRMIGVVLIFRDVTEERRATAALRRAEESARFLADASAALNELTDYESTLQKVASLAVPFFADWCAVDMRQPDGSLRRLAVTHMDPAKVQLAHDLLDRYPLRPDDAHGAMNVLRTGQSEWAAMISDEFLAESTHDDEHLQLIRNLGLRSYICVPIRSRSEIMGTLTFVTAESQRSYDLEDVRSAEDLAYRSSVAIENSKLLAALKEADRRKDEFLAVLAHELRNPLAPIRNAVQILRAKALPVPELQWARAVIDRQVEQMTRLVDDLLDVSRITQGKIELRKERVALSAVVNDAVEASRPLIEKWGHTLAVQMPPEPVYLNADSTRLAQIFLNLLNNAAKYTEQGGKIWFDVEQEGDWVVARVKDTGIGISPEMLPRIFDMFTQVDRSMARSEGGLGIGLTLVQRLVAMHGGTIQATSAGTGEGSEFIVRLPISRPVEVAPAAAAEPAAADSACRILVVDDNRDACESLAMLLGMMGHEVQTAHDGLSAVGAAEVFVPDIILLDIGLPKLNGYEVARRIREQRGAGVLLIALTGWGQEEDRRRSREAGFDRHMIKPIEFDALNELLAGATRQEPAGQPGNR